MTSAASRSRYIAGWGEDGALDAIREYAETIDTIDTIDTIARQIEDALDSAHDMPPAADAAIAVRPLAA